MEEDEERIREDETVEGKQGEDEESEKQGEEFAEVKETEKEGSKLIIVLVSIIVLAILFLIALMTFFIIESRMETNDSLGEREMSAFSEDLMSCIKTMEKNGTGERCNIMFLDPNIETECLKLKKSNGDLKIRNLCFYFSGIINEDEELCNKIDNSSLENSCVEGIEKESLGMDGFNELNEIGNYSGN